MSDLPSDDARALHRYPPPPHGRRFRDRLHPRDEPPATMTLPVSVAIARARRAVALARERRVR